MGGAVSTKGAKSDGGAIISLSQAHKGMRLFQHKVSGEIIVLFNEDMVSYLGESARGQYDEAALSSQQAHYFEHIQIRISIPKSNLSLTPVEEAPTAAPVPAPPMGEPARSIPLAAAAPADDAVRKRLSNLRMAAAEKDSFADSEGPSGAFSLADPKGSSSLSDKDSKRSGNYRKFFSQPYFPPSAYQQDSRLVDEWHSHSFSEAPAFDTKDRESPKRQEKEDSERSTGSLPSGKVARCKLCGECYFGRGAIEALEDHQGMCSMHMNLRKQLEEPDDKLRNALSSFASTQDDRLNTVMAAALSQGAEDLAAAAALFRRVHGLVRKALSLQVATASERYLRRLRDTINGDLELLRKGMDEAVDDIRGQALRQRLTMCHTALSDAQEQLKEKAAILRGHHRAPRQTTRDFKFLRLLGKGGFASVYLARRYDTRKLCAIKVLSKEQIRAAQCQTQVQRERQAMSIASRYPDYFVRFLSSFQSARHLFIVMEYVQGGDCMTLLTSLKRLPEVVAQHFIAQIALGVRHLHRHGVVHRDIKPDNILITSMGHAKLGDFGLIVPYTRDAVAPEAQTPRRGSHDLVVMRSPRTKRSPGAAYHASEKQRSWLEEEVSGLFAVAQPKAAVGPIGMRQDLRSGSMFQDIWSAGSDSSLFLPPSFDDHSPQRSAFAAAQADAQNPRKKLRSLVGNYHYACPELVMRKGYDHSVDWWALAVLCFHFVAGTTPFESDSQEQTMDNIVAGAVNWAELPAQTSEQCKAFIAAIITETEPDRRLGFTSSEQILGHAFFRDVDFSSIYHGYGPIFPQLKPAAKATKLSQSQSQSFSASFVDHDHEDDIDTFTSVNSEMGASDLAQLIAAEQPGDKGNEQSFDFLDFDCLYA